MKVNSDNKKLEKVRYLSHHAVYHEDQAFTKTRIVFDGSCCDGNEVSLNDCVLPGPAIQQNLVSVLLRFWSHPVAIMADVRKMFLQIKLAKEDQDDVITKNNKKQWENADLGGTKQIIHRLKGFDESYSKL